MDFSRLKQMSLDRVGSAEKMASSLSSSLKGGTSKLTSTLSDGTSKMLTQVVANKNEMLSDLSSKFENTFLRTDSIPSDEEEGEGQRSKEQPIGKGENKQHSDTNGRRGEVLSGVNYSFDKPLYNGPGTYTNTSQNSVINTQGSKTSGTNAKTDQSNSTQKHDSSNPPPRPPKLARRSSTVDEMLFDDYKQPQQGDAVPKVLPHSDLMSFDRSDSRDDNYNDMGKKNRKNENKREPSSFDSETDAELAAIRADSSGADSSEPEYESEPPFRAVSAGSEKSWSSTFSNDNKTDEETRQCVVFMKRFTEDIFNARSEIIPTQKAEFGQLCQLYPGRLWFARYVNTQRSHKNVEEETFFRLVQYFAVVLFECNFAEDFSPAKSLMNMCFTFYHESPQPNGKKYKHFLYSSLREQPIWQSLRFWNAAFFDAIQCERARRPICTSQDCSNAQIDDDTEYQKNITFGQLGTFITNMRAFGLAENLCIEFLTKQCTIANLKKEQYRMLKANIERAPQP